MSAPDDTQDVDRVNLAAGATNQIARDPHTQNGINRPQFDVQFNSRSSNHSSRQESEARKPRPRQGYARRHPNVAILGALIAMTIIVLSTVLPITLRMRNDDPSKDSNVGTYLSICNDRKLT